MMKKGFIATLLLGSLVLWPSCDREDDINVWNTQLPQLIMEKYPNASIIEGERVVGGYEVSAFVGGVEAEIYFNSKYQWLRTEFDTYWNALPEEVRSGVEAAGYQQYIFEEIERVETATSTTYRFQIDREPKDLVLVFDSLGQRIQ